jgi:hypothetical protein
MPSLPMVLVLVFKVEEGLSDVRASGGMANSDDGIFEGLFRGSNLRMTFGVHMESIKQVDGGLQKE